MGTLSDILYGKKTKAKRVAPLAASAEETFLLNYLMQMYKSNTGPVANFRDTMSKATSMKGVPINYKGKEVASMMPLKSMATLGNLATQQLAGETNLPLQLWQQLNTMRNQMPVSTGGRQPSILSNIVPGLVQSGAMPGAMGSIGGGLESVGQAFASITPEMILNLLPYGV